MLYCNKCKKEVVIYGVSSLAKGASEIVKGAREGADKGGYLILFNPPPPQVEPYKCPKCGTKIKEK